VGGLWEAKFFYISSGGGLNFPPGGGEKLGEFCVWSFFQKFHSPGRGGRIKPFGKSTGHSVFLGAHQGKEGGRPWGFYLVAEGGNALSRYRGGLAQVPVPRFPQGLSRPPAKKRLIRGGQPSSLQFGWGEKIPFFGTRGEKTTRGREMGGGEQENMKELAEGERGARGGLQAGRRGRGEGI